MAISRKERVLFDAVDDLKQLIVAADKCHVNFVYALSPGLDIVFTSAGDMDALKAKLNQVRIHKPMFDVPR